ncbi:hypothetical protein PT974_07995 [Cladobotryum mycophilum]|uniref:SigF-like NTF2-like domain-containing protein n=1 Tax=Cladobotryum mycophilum TaxID=491253 RepID=A0ABR0SDJ7_9HYPO
MEHPVREVAHVVETLCMGSPQQQQDTLQNYFLSDASFTHPFCRVPPFSKGTIPFAPETDSRWLILAIYRWYRIISPRIKLKVDSSVFDQRTGLLYLSIHQIFSLWFVPFHKADVNLVTVLQLVQRSSAESGHATTKHHADGRGSSALAGPGQERLKYYIASQEDFYQTNDFVKFIIPWFVPLFLFLFQLFSTGLCVVGSIILLPLYFFMNNATTDNKTE